MGHHSSRAFAGRPAFELPEATWEELARSAPERAQRRIAFRRASEARPAE